MIGTLLAGFAGMTVANRAMRPIADLTGTARTIARTRDPSLRIPEPENEDEVAELARTLDEMLRELDAARAETENTIQRQREFVADASHELRTPLTSILANLELLEAALEPGDEDGDELAATRSALRSSRRMSRLVGDLLILARADAGRRGEPVPCDLARIASEAVEEVDPVAEGHTFTTELGEEAPVVGDPDELHRMVLNLLENAIRHTPAGHQRRAQPAARRRAGPARGHRRRARPPRRHGGEGLRPLRPRAPARPTAAAPTARARASDWRSSRRWRVPTAARSAPAAARPAAPASRSPCPSSRRPNRRARRRRRKIDQRKRLP